MVNKTVKGFVAAALMVPAAIGWAGDTGAIRNNNIAFWTEKGVIQKIVASSVEHASLTVGPNFSKADAQSQSDICRLALEHVQESVPDAAELNILDPSGAKLGVYGPSGLVTRK